MKSFLILVSGIISFIYLINPGAGILELIPDGFPVIGNLDEAAAVAVLLACLRHFGLDLTAFFNRKKLPKGK